MPNWWLVSWTTYGTWLPGDPRGFCTWRKREYIPPPKRYAQSGEATFRADEFKSLHDLAQQISDPPVYFTIEQIQTALAAIIEEITHIRVVPAIISLRRWHVHWLCHFGTLRIRPTVGRVKAAATRELNLHGFVGKRAWTKGCNMRSKSTRSACRNAYKYIRDHQSPGCLIHEWQIDPNYLEF